MRPEEVTACIVTRGDIEIAPVLKTLIFKKRIVWDNRISSADMGAFGRYAAASLAEGVVYFQDDDCLVPREDQQRLLDAYEPGVLTVLMPPDRTDYTDTVLIGWGAICDSDLPFKAFLKWEEAGHMTLTSDEFKVVGADFVFPMLTPHKRLDGYHRDLPHAHAPNRTWGSWPNYAAVKDWYLESAREIRDGS